MMDVTELLDDVHYFLCWRHAMKTLSALPALRERNPSLSAAILTNTVKVDCIRLFGKHANHNKNKQIVHMFHRIYDKPIMNTICVPWKFIHGTYYNCHIRPYIFSMCTHGSIYGLDRLSMKRINIGSPSRAEQGFVADLAILLQANAICRGAR